MDNKITLNGIITRVNDIQMSSDGKKYLHFDIALKKNTYILVKVYQDKLERYSEVIKKGKRIEIQGYLNTYINRNDNKKTFIALSSIKELTNNKDLFYTDEEGNEYWHGKKISYEEASKDEIQELEKILKGYKEDDYGL